jgi:hypothetical protein
LAVCALALAACSPAGSSLPDAAACSGAVPSTMLVEGFCKHGEADRCFYSTPPMDDF